MGRGAVALVLVTLSAVSASMQSPRGMPRITLPDTSQQERAQQEREIFRTSVTRVEVSALVLDRDGKPVRGLTAADFELLENGVPQIVKSFAPFTYQPEPLELPTPVPRRNAPEARFSARPPRRR
jgi:hypothetical protein